MSSRIKEIDDCDVRYMYEVEGMTLQAIADYYNVSPLTIYWRLYPEKQKENNKRYLQTENSKESRKKYQQSENGKESVKRYSQSENGKETAKRYLQTEKGKETKRRYFQSETGKETNKIWRKSDKGKEVRKRAAKKWRESEHGKEYIKKWEQSDKGKEHRRKVNDSRRKLGHILLNAPFLCSEGHHIDVDHIIHIPKDIHRKIAHNVWTGHGMEEINREAINFLECDINEGIKL